MKIFILLLALCLVISACQNKSDQESEDVQLQKATRQIDKGEYKEAIQALAHLKSRTANPKVTMTLASAYAGRAGIKVDQYWGFVVGYEALLPEVKDLEKSAAKNPKYAIAAQWIAKLPSEQDRKWVEQLNKTLEQMDGILARIERIPYVERDHREDLHTAVQELSTIKTQGSALYKAILEVILLKSAIQDTQKIFESLLQKDARCEQNTAQLITWVQYSARLLSHILEDIAQAYPSKRAPIEQVASGLRPVHTLLVPELLQSQMAKVCQ